MATPGDVKKSLRRLSENLRDPLWWKDQWDAIEPRKRLTFVISTVLIGISLFSFIALLITWRPSSSTHRIGPANNNFVSTRTPVPAARVADPLLESREKRNPHQIAADLLKNQTGAIEQYIEQVLSGEHVDNTPWIGAYMSCYGMDRDQFRAAYTGDRIRVARWKAGEGVPEFEGTLSLASTVASCFRPWAGAEKFRVECRFSEFALVQKTVVAQLTVEVFGRPDFTFGRQATSLWETRWELNDSFQTLILQQVTVRMQEEIVNYTNGGSLFQECTGGVMKHVNFDQSFYGVDHWARRIPGIDIVGDHGISVCDINKDGLDDLYVCEPHGLPNLLLLQNADGTVRSEGVSQGVDILDESYCALIVDFDNDGDQDLAVSTDEALVLMSQNNGSFEVEKHISACRGVRSLCAADYDNDGDLDIFATRYLPAQAHNDLFPRPNSYRLAESGGRNLLLRNDEAWRFTDVTEDTGLGAGNHRYSRSAVWIDYDRDGDQDLYITNEFHGDQLYTNAEGWFTAVAVSTGNDQTAIQRSVSPGDFDGDGRPDLFAASSFSPQSTLEINSMPGQPSRAEENFTGGCRVSLAGDSGTPRGYRLPAPVFVPGQTYSSAAVDLNNDGYDDILLTNGGLTRRRMQDVSGYVFRNGAVAQRGLDENRSTVTIRNAFDAVAGLCRQGYSYEAEQRNRCFLSLGPTGFANFSACSGLDIDDDGRGIAVSDWDGDGDLDVVTNNRSGPRLRFFSNQLASTNQWVAFQLVGTKSNRDAIGSRVEVILAGRQAPVTRILSAGGGANSQSSKRMLFGLGSASEIREVRVQWPDGSEQVFTGVLAGRTYVLTEGRVEAAESSSNRSDLVSLTASPPPPPDVVSADTFNRSVFYPRVEIPLLQFQGAEQEFFEVESFENRPVLVIFWSRDSTSESLLANIAEQSARYSECDLDLIAIYVDRESDSVSSDWNNARDSIEETGYPFRWGTAAQSTVQKAELLLGEWFAHQDISEMPFALLLDGDEKVAVFYPGNQIEFETVRDDLAILGEPQYQYRHRATPYAGIWLARYRQPSYRRLISVFAEYGFDDDASIMSLHQEPATALELTQRGQDLRSSRRPEEARNAFEEALEHDDKCVPAHIALGSLLASFYETESEPNLREQYLDAALARFETAISIDPANTEAILQSSLIYQTRNQIDEAIRVLNDCLVTDPDKWEVHASIGRLYYQKGELRKAADYLVAAYENRPSLPGVAGDLGCLYLKNKQYDDGLTFLRKARRLQPNDPYQNSWLVYAEFVNGNFDEAIELANDAANNQQDQRSRSILAWLLATSPFESHRDGGRAIEVLTPQIVIKGGVSAKVLEIQAAALAETGEFEQAVEIQQKAIDMIESGNAEETYTDQQKSGMLARLDLYRSERPYRMSELESVPIPSPSLN